MEESNHASPSPVSGSSSTVWQMLELARNAKGTARVDLHNFLIDHYRAPVILYIRGRGYFSDAELEDLAQEFFLHCIQKDVFGRADAAKGRFRSFLYTTLNNFLSNARRYNRAECRRPKGGFVSIHDLTTDVVERELPDFKGRAELFNHAWMGNLLVRILKAFETECEETGKTQHFEILRRQLVEPILEGGRRPSHREIGEEMGLTEKAVANRLLTAKRAMERLIRDEIRLYSESSEEEAEEIELFLAFLENS